jgi:SAM-dependent methyltransferase
MSIRRRGWRDEGLDPSLLAYMDSPDATALEGGEEDSAPLARFDRVLLRDWLPDPCRVADLGCGTGRTSLDLASRGHQVVAVDLSPSRLGRLSRRLDPDLAVVPILANLCEPLPLAPGGFDAVLLMYSTLGMVRSRAARRAVLRRASGIIRPEGRLIVHAHSFWANLHPSSFGPRLSASGFPKSGWIDRLGDTPTRFAGVPNLKIHVYRWLELENDLRATGFRVRRTITLARGSGGALVGPAAMIPWRADGWIVEAGPVTPPAGRSGTGGSGSRS